MDVTGANVWMLPLANILHCDYGSKGKLIVSTQYGLFEADSRRRTVEQLQKPTTGRLKSLNVALGSVCSPMKPRYTLGFLVYNAKTAPHFLFFLVCVQCSF